MACPGLWVYGSLDTSIPVGRSIAILDGIRTRLNKDFTSILRPNWNHCWIVNGSMCECAGETGNASFIFEWINDKTIPPPAF